MLHQRRYRTFWLTLLSVGSLCACRVSVPTPVLRPAAAPKTATLPSTAPSLRESSDPNAVLSPEWPTNPGVQPSALASPESDATVRQASAVIPTQASVALAGRIRLRADALLRNGGVAVLSGEKGPVVSGLEITSLALISNNGGGVVSNNGGGLISNNGGGLAVFQRDGATLIGAGGVGLRGAAALQTASASRYAVMALGNAWGLLTASAKPSDSQSEATPPSNEELTAIGMSVQIIDLDTGAPIQMVDNSGRLGDTVLSDFEGRFTVMVPEKLQNNVMIRVNVPGHLANPRARFGMLTIPAASDQTVLDEAFAAYTTQCRLLGVSRVANGLLDLRDADGVITANPSFVKTFNQTARDAGITQWSRSDRQLLAQRVADSVLARVGNLSRIPVYQGLEQSQVMLAFLAGTNPPDTGEMAGPIWEQFIRRVAQATDERTKGGEDLSKNPVIRRVNDYLANRRANLPTYPAWAPEEGFEFQKGTDVTYFVFQAVFAARLSEIAEISNDADFKAALTAAGVPQVQVMRDSRRSLFIKLGITLGLSEAESGAEYDRAMAAFRSIGAVFQREYVRDEQRYLDILKDAATPEGFARLKAMNSARL